MSNILVTGAAGFIGSQLAYRLWRDGEEVILLDDFSYGHEDNLVFEDHSFVDEIRRVDICNVEAMESLFRQEQFDYVYHMAGITPLPDCQNNPVRAVNVNVGGTTNVLDLVRRYGIKKMFFASTSAVYENCTDFPSKESEVEYPSLIYPSTKFSAEQICRAFSRAYGIPVVCFRFANVYGPHIDCLRTQPPVMGYIIREFFKESSPVLHATGEQKRDYIYVDDLIDLCIATRSAEDFDIVNVSTNTTFSINHIVSLIAKMMDCERIKIEYEDALHYWANYPQLYDEPYPIYGKLLENEVLKYTCLSNQHAKDAYGWMPKTSLEEGIRKTVDYCVKALNKSGIK